MRNNPYHRFIGPEAWLQHRVIKWLSYRYPQCFVIHPNNEGKRSPFESFLAKFLGLVPGVSDLIIVAPSARVLFLELKSEGNKPTEYQMSFLKRMAEMGFDSTWADNDELAQKIIDNFMETK